MMNWSQQDQITTAGQYVISTHPNEGRVCVTDLGARKIISKLDIGKTANHIVLSRDGKHPYVSSGGTNSIVEIDTKDWCITRRLAGGSYPGQMGDVARWEIDLCGQFPHRRTVGRIRERTKRLGRGLHGIDIDPDGVYISGGDTPVRGRTRNGSC